MTNERARSELNQIYGMLSEEKKKAIDTLIKASQGTILNCPSCGLEVHSDFSECPRCGEQLQTCGNCRNEDTYHCAECENKSDYEQAQADGEYISKSDMIDWLKDIRHKMKPQNYHTASEFEIAENQIWNLIQMLQMGAFPTVVIPSEEPKTGHWILHNEGYYDESYVCSECDGDSPFDYKWCPYCGAKMD